MNLKALKNKYIFLINHADETSPSLIMLAKEYGKSAACFLFESKLAYDKYHADTEGYEYFVIADSRIFEKNSSQTPNKIVFSRKIIFPEIDRIHWWFGNLGFFFKFFKRQFWYLESNFNIYLLAALKGIQKLGKGCNIYILYEPPSTALNNYLFSYSNELNLNCIGLRSARAANRMEIHATFQDFYENVKAFYELSIRSDYEFSHDALKYARSIGRSAPNYFVLNNSRKKGVFDQLIKLFNYRDLLKRLPSLDRENLKTYQAGNFLITSLGWWLNNLINRSNALRLNTFLARKKYKKKSNGFYIFPLHYHPEASTSVEAFGYSDDICFIEALRNSIPANHDLVVREHPNAIGIRPKKFYKKIMELPDVYLDAASGIYDLVKESNGVITLGGTLGFEAAVLGVHAYTFVRSFYCLSNNVFYVANIADLSDRIIDTYNIKAKPDLEIACAYFDACLQGDIFTNPSASSIDELKKSLDRYLITCT